MRILYVTACLPYGAAEAFLIDEITQLTITHEVLIVPRSPGQPGPHGLDLLPYAKRESLFSWRVFVGAMRCLITHPVRVAKSCRPILRSGSVSVFVRNIAVIPKALWLANLAGTWRADHIHCHWAGTTATMAMIASRISAVPWSLTAHRSDIVGNNLLRDKARSATMVRAISVGGKRMLAGFGVPEASVRVIPIGVRIPSAAALGSFSKAVVLCPADLLEVKGHKFLLQAWRILLDRGICGELWLAGTGHLGPALRKLAYELEIQSSAFFLGTLSHTALLQHYAHSRISCVVLASIDLGAGCHEGIPVSLVEAMSYGVPVVATSTGSIPELIEPDTGFLVPPCDPNALADSIETLLRHSQLARQIGATAHRHVAGTRNVVTIAAALETHFQAQLRADLRCCA